jgi:DNA-directed RNA polymerase specialized sigma24 family protein/TolA-binding protein
MAGKERGGLRRWVAGQPHRREPADALAALAKAASTGDRAAVRTFLVTIGPHLLWGVRRVLGASHPDVDDIAQESAFAVMAALPGDRGESTILQLVSRVAVLTAMNVGRRDATPQRNSRGEHELELSPASQSAPDVAGSEQDRAGLAFDAEAPVLAGDAERIARIARNVQKGTRRVRLSPRARQAAQSLALGVLIAGVASAAIELSRWHPKSSQGAGWSSAPGAAQTSPWPAFGRDQRLVAVAPEPALPEVSGASAAPPHGASVSAVPAPSSAASAPAPAHSTPTAAHVADAQSPPAEAKFKTASELFADANTARVRGDARAAITSSQQLEATFPNSTEGITTHLSLGVLYLQQGQPALALQELKIYRHIGNSEMMAEALWGEEQALQQLGRSSEERAVLEELLQNYPRSAYAAAAEKRLAALNN